jgi:hypothetical protein
MQFNASVWYPTALLVKTHNLTGKKYFCKTTKLDKLDTYTGSGLAWKSHLKQFGKDISTGVVGVYYESERCLEAAKKYSKEWNIVESNEWLNLIDENGLDGAGAGVLHHMYGKPHPDKGSKRPDISARMSGANNPNYGIKWSEERKKAFSEARTGKPHHRPLGSKSGMKGKAYPEEGKRKLSEVLKGRVGPNLGKQASEETKAKMSASQKAHWEKVGSPNKGRKASEETKAKMRAARAKRIYTDADKQKISEAVTAWHKQRKEQ